MPTSSGKLQLIDYDNALVARGFDGFTQPDRFQMINLGYRYIARKFPWAWEQSTGNFVVSPGSYQVALSGMTTLGADNIDFVYITTDPYRAKLQPMSKQRFTENWLFQDLTAASARSTPTSYTVFEGNLYILPPPSSQISVAVHFKGYLVDMVVGTDAPATPQILDEVVLDAALVRAHRRAHELTLAQEAQSRVDEALSDMLADDVWGMTELQDRVRPDNQWR